MIVLSNMVHWVCRLFNWKMVAGCRETLRSVSHVKNEGDVAAAIQELARFALS